MQRFRSYISNNKNDLFCILLLAGLTVGFLWRVVFLHQILLPADLIYTFQPWKSESSFQPAQFLWNPETIDPLTASYPLATFAKEARAQGAFFWNPYPLAGIPSLASADVFTNPLLVIFSLFLSTAQAFSWADVFHLFLGGLFMFLLLREMGVKQFGALIGALAFTFNGYLIAWLSHPTVNGGMIWLPLVFWGTEKAIHKQDWRWCLASALAFVLQILSGIILWPFYGAITLMLYVAYRSILQWVEKKQIIPALRPLWYGGLTLGLGTLIAAPQLLIAIELFLNSQRSNPFGTGIILDIKPLILRLFAPTVFGNPIHGNTYWGQANYTETALYFGVLPLLFILASPWSPKRKIAWAFGAIGLITYLAVDKIFPFRQLTSLLYPVFLNSNPLRIFYIVAFSWSVAAGLGADGLTSDDSKQRSRRMSLIASILVAGLAALLMLTFYRTPDPPATFLTTLAHKLPLVSRKALTISIIILSSSALLLYSRQLNVASWVITGMLLALTASDLLMAGINYNPAFSEKLIYPETPSLHFLTSKDNEDIPPDRVVSLNANYVLPDMTPQLYRLPFATGYTPWVLQRYADYTDLTHERTPTPQNYIYFGDCCDRLLDALNVRYIFAPSGTYPSSLGLFGLASHLDQAVIGPATGSLVYGTSWMLDGKTQSILLEHPPATLTYHLLVNKQFVLKTAITLDPAVWDKVGDGVLFTIYVDTANSPREILFEQYIDPKNNISDRKTFPIEIDLSKYSGSEISLTLETQPGPKGDSLYDWAGWVEPRIENYSESTLVNIYDGANKIYVNTEAYPRAWVVHYAVQVAKNNTKAIKGYLSDSNFDLKTIAVVETENGSNQLTKYAPKKVYSGDYVHITHYSAEIVSMIARLEQPGLLILSDMAYPGWKVYIDGSEQTILTTNLIMRGVILGPGEHQVEFKYVPGLFFIGLAVSGSTLFLIVLAVLFLPKLTLNWRSKKL